MYFTSEEKKAIVRVAGEMTLADGNVAPKEVVFNVGVFHKLDISQSEIESSGSMSMPNAMHIISKMTSNEKRFVSAYIGSIIIVDGNISDKELALWRLISTICEFPTMHLNDTPSILQEYL